MTDDTLHLVKIPFRADGLVRVAKRRSLPVHDLDDGYLTHAILRELWQEHAPAPFVVRGQGRLLDVWGYCGSDAEQLASHALEFGDPTLLATIHGGLEDLASRPMTRFDAGRRIGFEVRACPIVRLAKGHGGRAGREVDAFLAHCWRHPDDASVQRERVYRDWLARQFEPESSGVDLHSVRLDAFARSRLVRRGKPGADGKREARRLERPDVQFSGNLQIVDPDRFAALLRRGIGRHRAFGFGMLRLVPPRDLHARTATWS